MSFWSILSHRFQPAAPPYTMIIVTIFKRIRKGITVVDRIYCRSPTKWTPLADNTKDGEQREHQDHAAPSEKEKLRK